MPKKKNRERKHRTPICWCVCCTLCCLTLFNTALHCSTLLYTALHCSTLLYSAVQCCTLLYTAVYYPPTPYIYGTYVCLLVYI